MLCDLLYKRFFIMDAVVARSMASGRHGDQVNALSEVDQVTSIHGKVFLSSALQSSSILILLSRIEASCGLIVSDGGAHAVP
jgi:hypothetical protein